MIYKTALIVAIALVTMQQMRGSLCKYLKYAFHRLKIFAELIDQQRK